MPDQVTIVDLTVGTGATPTQNSVVSVTYSGNVIYRGEIIEKTGGRPKFFMGAFGHQLASRSAVRSPARWPPPQRRSCSTP